MKPHLANLLARQRAGNAGTLIGAYGADDPTESEVYLQMIEGLLCDARVWERPFRQLYLHEQRGLILLAEEITAGARIALCCELGKVLRAEGLLPPLTPAPR